LPPVKSAVFAGYPSDSSDAELARIPETKRTDGPVTRSEVRIVQCPPFNQVTNRVAFVFEGAMAECR